MSIDQPSFENLLRHDGEAFVRAAYERLLRRSPSADEVRSWLVRLCDGSLTKREVLTAIRASPEGRAQAIALPGLVSSRFAMLIRRAPVIGYAVRWLEQAARLPRTAQRMSACETAIAVLRDEQAAIAHAVCKLDASAQANQAATAVFRDEQATLARAVC
ncbi:MAG TPA: DUF4214 domain-containing protein, partial [Kofleriaceae bacterium]|nr:DUF4214 domain-containing protein [Kofleriaceae bacterium]